MLLTKPIVQHPLFIAFVAPAMLFSTPQSAKLCPLLPIDDKATVEPLLEGIIATAGQMKRKNICILLPILQLHSSSINFKVVYGDDGGYKLQLIMH